MTQKELQVRLETYAIEIIKFAEKLPEPLVGGNQQMISNIN
ncbi:hypothetical protein Emtol_0098 (plasmid) [Emticicia oligotrophica DSM 17448]|uniref:Uncharacterized protein n=1 Tax=Emticicia oligotrophica (strain DSM 17448 / CIP 109782 / MTCC 6937 / GPTSA100-15) TaxID=929562 RepID=A0ABM5N819_EMTOG|nr:hypothetical protein [Emticicia oligotrophica]AFK05616.1 hypothetical protein Emtol_0098 [Emticicia oligotrophica DSM 17448]